MPGQRLSSPLPDNCTTAGATGTCSADGRALIGSTSDDPFTTRTRLVVEETAGRLPVRRHPDRVPGPEHRGQLQPHAHTWAQREGLRVHLVGGPARTRTSSLTARARWCALLPFRRPAAEPGRLRTGCDSACWSSYPRAIHGNFLFADSGGEVALAEVSTRRLNIETRTTDGWIGRSNHWISPEMSRIAHTPAVGDSTVVRYDRITTLMAEAPDPSTRPTWRPASATTRR